VKKMNPRWWPRNGCDGTYTNSKMFRNNNSGKFWSQILVKCGEGNPNSPEFFTMGTHIFQLWAVLD